MDVDMSCIADENYKPSLFDVHTILDKWIVGDYQARMAVFTN